MLPFVSDAARQALLNTAEVQTWRKKIAALSQTFGVWLTMFDTTNHACMHLIVVKNGARTFM